MANQQKGTFVRPRLEDACNTNTGVDYIEVLNNALERDPGNTLNENSQVFKVAIEQYNNSLKKGSLKRKPIPKGFCGYIDPETGQLRSSAQNFINNTLTGFVTNATNNLGVDVADQSGLYPDDGCLELGLPGSPAYALCQTDDADFTTEPNGLDWAAAIASEEERAIVAEFGTSKEEALASIEGLINELQAIEDSTDSLGNAILAGDIGAWNPLGQLEDVVSGFEDVLSGDLSGISDLAIDTLENAIDPLNLSGDLRDLPGVGSVIGEAQDYIHDATNVVGAIATNPIDAATDPVGTVEKAWDKLNPF